MFVQIIEFRTRRVEEFEALETEWLRATEGKRTAQRLVLCRDRDRDDTYVQIVEFPSREDAMRNSELPETSQGAARIASLCEGPPVFRNLEVLSDQTV
jgi:quinol monooxygenase YgiN